MVDSSFENRLKVVVTGGEEAPAAEGREAQEGGKEEGRMMVLELCSG